MVNDKKIDVIKKVLMLDTEKELQVVLDVVTDAICRELDDDNKDRKDFAEWKAKNKKEAVEEIPF
tara:strand:- start:152 stop:346 length:195 start_codon:yes stop_codon:yes gene_type:complete